LWAKGFGMLKEGAWLYGIGAGGWSGMAGGVHNALLQSLLEGGIVEFILHLSLFIWLIKTGLKSNSKEGIILVALLVGIFTRNLAESNDLLFGLFNNCNVFISWYVLISLLILNKKRMRDDRLLARWLVT